MFGMNKNPLVSSIFCMTFDEYGDHPVPPTSEFRITDASELRMTDGGDKRITD